MYKVTIEHYDDVDQYKATVQLASTGESQHYFFDSIAEALVYAGRVTHGTVTATDGDYKPLPA